MKKLIFTMLMLTFCSVAFAGGWVPSTPKQKCYQKTNAPIATGGCGGWVEAVSTDPARKAAFDTCNAAVLKNCGCKYGDSVTKQALGC